MAGPLEGLRVIEMAGQGPVPFCAMLLADMGADVIRVDRPGRQVERFDVTCRSRSSLNIDLRAEGAVSSILSMVTKADILLEGFRPGVMERLGLGPTACFAANPKLVYGRMTGWGQSGPLAQTAGHDINYIAIAGALHAVGKPEEPPIPPLNYVGDYAGGAMLLLSGVLAALHETQRSGSGQVVDAAMSDGAALMSSVMYGLKAAGEWSNRRGENLLDGGAHFYSTYECADGRYLSVGAIEPQFYRQMCELCSVEEPHFNEQMDKAGWPAMKMRFARLFLTRSRNEWISLLEGSDACVSPVLDWDEAPAHPHNVARDAFISVEGVVQPAPAPRFSRTPHASPRPHSSSSVEVLFERWGIDPLSVATMREDGSLGKIA